MQYQDGDTRDVNGTTYLRQGGQWVAQTSAAPPAFAPISGGERQPAPQTAPQVAKDQADASLAAARVSMIPVEQDEARARTALVQAQAGQIGKTSDAMAAKQKGASLDSLTQQINRVQDLFDQTVGKTSGVGGIVDYLPTAENRQFDTAAAGLAEQGLAAFRVPGVGAQSDTELRQFVQANKPSASDYDTSIEEKLLQLRTRVDATRQAMGLSPAKWNVNGADGQSPPSGGGERVDRTQQQMFSPGGETLGLSQNGYRTGDDPALAGVNSRINALLKEGRPISEVAKYMADVGIPAREVQQILYGRSRGQELSPAEFRRRYPNYKGDWKIDVDNTQIPLSGLREGLNSAAQTPGGSYAVGAADALSLGTLDNMTSNPALTRAGMSGLREQNPLSTLAGNVTGGTLAAGGGELLAARAGLQGVRAAIAGDAAFGAGYGAGSADEGSRLGGAAFGAALGVGGGFAGRAVTRGAGRALTGSRDAATRYLTDRGIPLTVGQIAGRGGVVGRAAKRIEDGLESIPILGSAIRARRAEGTEAFNTAAFREALEPIPPTTVSTIAEQGVEQAQTGVSRAYDQALNGVEVRADRAFVRDMRRAMATGQDLHPEVAGDFDNLIRTQVAPELANGRLTGEGYQALRQVIRRERKVWEGLPRGEQYGQALRQLEGGLERLVRRRAPGRTEALDAADRAYRRTGIVRDAVSKARNNSDSGGVFTPVQLGNAAAANAKRFDNTQGTTRQPFFELQRAGQDILPSKVPNSGTADRAFSAAIIPTIAGAGAAGQQAGYIDPSTAGIFVALSIPFTRAGQATFQRLLVQRPELIRAVGQQVARRSGAGGLFGAGGGASLAAQ